MPTLDPAAPSPRPGVDVRPSTPADVDAIVDLHLQHLPHGLFPRLGTAFMRRYHRTFIELERGISLVAVVPDPPGPDVVIGFVCGSTDQRRYVADVLGAARGPLLLAGAAGLVRHPFLLLHFVRTRSRRYVRRIVRALRPSRHDRQGEVERGETRPVAVLSAVVVSPTARAGGAGAALVAGLVERVQRAGTRTIELVTLAGPDGAVPFYRALGWTEVGTHEDKDGHEVVRFRMELAGVDR